MAPRLSTWATAAVDQPLVRQAAKHDQCIKLGRGAQDELGILNAYGQNAGHAAVFFRSEHGGSRDV